MISHKRKMRGNPFRLPSVHTISLPAFRPWSEDHARKSPETTVNAPVSLQTAVRRCQRKKTCSRSCPGLIRAAALELKRQTVA